MASVGFHAPRPGDNWRKDLHRVRLTLLKIMAEAGNSWQTLMMAHDALWRAEFQARGLIAESEHHAGCNGAFEEDGAPQRRDQKGRKRGMNLHANLHANWGLK